MLKMAEKQFNVDLDDKLIARVDHFLADHPDLGKKGLCARALVAYMNGQDHFPFLEANRRLHEDLETILNSGDAATIAALKLNIEVFRDRLKAAPGRRRASFLPPGMTPGKPYVEVGKKPGDDEDDEEPPAIKRGK